MLKICAGIKLIVIAGSASPKLSARVARELGCELIKPVVKRFPDGEFYVRIEAELEGEHVVVVQSTCSPQNDNLIELCFLIGTARDLGAKRVTAFVPYLAYARQDKRFKPGEAVSASTICRLIEAAGATDFVTVDVHHDEVMRNFSIPAYSLTAMPLLGRYLNKLELRDPVVLGADKGSIDRAKRVSLEMGAEHDHLEKKRISPRNVVVEPKRLNVLDRDVVIVDDIISTGGTIIEAVRMLKRQKARRIYAACTHPVLVGKALRRIKIAGIKNIISTDTIEHPVSRVSVAPLITEVL